jgi:hypothetical protein
MTCTECCVEQISNPSEAGWIYLLKPVEGWACPFCIEPHEDELRLNEVRLLMSRYGDALRRVLEEE